MKTLGYIATGVFVLIVVVLIVFWPSAERTSLVSQGEAVDELCAKNLANAQTPMERQIVSGGCEQAKKEIRDKTEATR